jgi:hypothetical protein
MLLYTSTACLNLNCDRWIADVETKYAHAILLREYVQKLPLWRQEMGVYSLSYILVNGLVRGANVRKYYALYQVVQSCTFGFQYQGFINFWFHSCIHQWLYSPLLGRGLPLLQFRQLFHTDGRTPCTSDQLDLRPLPTDRTTQTQNKRTHKHSCLSGIRTHEPSIRASEDSSGLRPRGHCDRLFLIYYERYYIANIPGSKGRPARKTDLTATCEPIV